MYAKLNSLKCCDSTKRGDAKHDAIEPSGGRPRDRLQFRWHTHRTDPSMRAPGESACAFDRGWHGHDGVGRPNRRRQVRPAFRLLPADANPLQLRHPTRIDIPQMKSGTA